MPTSTGDSSNRSRPAVAENPPDPLNVTEATSPNTLNLPSTLALILAPIEISVPSLSMRKIPSKRLPVCIPREEYPKPPWMCRPMPPLRATLRLPLIKPMSRSKRVRLKLKDGPMIRGSVDGISKRMKSTSSVNSPPSMMPMMASKSVRMGRVMYPPVSAWTLSNRSLAGPSGGEADSVESAMLDVLAGAL